MLRPLADAEPYMYRSNNIASAYFLEPTHHGKDVARMLIEQSPAFHLKIKDECLWKADPVLLEIPSSIRQVDEAIDWLLAHPSDNCAEIAYRKDMIAGRSTHAVGDGGHWVLAFNSLGGKKKKPVRQWIYTYQELFGHHFAKFTTPSALDLKRDAYQMVKSYPARATAEISELVYRVKQETFACYDRKVKKPIAMTEHAWASMLIAAILHNWELTGKVDTSKRGIITLVNTRPWIEKSLDVRNVGSAYSRVLPGAGPFSQDETLGAVTMPLRESMSKQLGDLEQIKVLRKPLAAPENVPMIVTNPGPVFMPGWIREGNMRETVGNVEPDDTTEWPFMITLGNLRFGNRPADQWVLTHGNKVVLSQPHIEVFRKRVMKGLVDLTMDLTVRQALEKIEPKIKGKGT
jgi:hypothetical protein